MNYAQMRRIHTGTVTETSTACDRYINHTVVIILNHPIESIVNWSIV